MPWAPVACRRSIVLRRTAAGGAPFMQPEFLFLLASLAEAPAGGRRPHSRSSGLAAPPTARDCTLSASAVRRAQSVRLSPVASESHNCSLAHHCARGHNVGASNFYFSECSYTGGLRPPRYRVLHVSYSRDPSKTIAFATHR